MVQPWSRSHRPEMRKRVGALDVLIVDDSVKFSECIENFIKETDDVRTFRAATAAEGVALARELRPAVVLMDVVLPDGSGIDATRRIVEELPGVAVIVMTFHVDPAYQRTALEVGARAFIVKQHLTSELHDILTDIRARRNADASAEADRDDAHPDRSRLG